MSSGPRIAVADIETAPALSYHWGQWQQNIANVQIVSAPHMMCFASKWAGEKTVEFHAEYDFENEVLSEAYRVAMVERAWGILDECDVFAHYNGDKFDIPHLYREFAEMGLGPPSPFKSVDLYRVAKRLRFFSHKLDYVARELRLGGKATTGGFQLWIDCLAGDPKAWRKMRTYNKRDAVVTDDLRVELLPWTKSPINQSLFGDGCPRCPSTKAPQKRGFRYTGVSKFQRYYCLSCKGWSSDGKRVEGAELRPTA